MMSEPPEDAIENFVSFTSASREKAISFLKANNLDSNRAINAYFENPDGATPEVHSEWPATTIGPEENYGYNQNIHSSETSNRAYGTAPSRPPSRIGSRESHGGVKLGEAIEVAGDQPAGVGTTSQAFSLADQEERELQQAMAMSLNPSFGSGPHGGQETGIVMTDNTRFGPASRDHYEETAWAMTLLESTGRDAYISPDPEDRQKANGEPAFCRPSEDAEHLGGLITILHSIPLAREALLMRDKLAPDYGYDEQWWNGQPITTPKVVSMSDTSYDAHGNLEEVLLEPQRLMAFLDSTNRAFGSTDALANLKPVSDYSSEQVISRFLEGWQAAAVAATPDNQLATIFSSLALKRPFSEEEEPIDREFFALDIAVDSRSSDTLYDALDSIVWSDQPDTDLDDVWLDHVAEVLTMRLSNTNPTKRCLDVKIPAVWYPDRYMDACKEFATKLRTRRLEVRAQLEWLETLADRYSSTTGSDNASVKLKTTLQRALDGARVALQEDLSNGFLQNGDNEGSPVITQENIQILTDQLKAISEKIDKKLESLEKRRQEALESLKQHSRELTTPPTSPNDPPYHKYTLRGVCTLPHITYVLKRDTAEKDADSSSRQSADEWQWWRISFSVDDAKARLAEATQTPVLPSSQTNPASSQAQKRGKVSASNNADVVGYTARRVREVEVLHAAKVEYPSVLLVYANENAVNFKEGALSEPLQAFVNKDNETFEAEIQEAEKNAQSLTPQATSTTSWPAIEPLTGPSVEATERETDTAFHSATDRVPPSNLPDGLVNVFDYQVNSFDEAAAASVDKTTRKTQEMQERNKRNISFGPMDPIISASSGSANNSTNPSNILDTPTSTAADTIELLESRLRRLEFLLTGDTSWTGEPRGIPPASAAATGSGVIDDHDPAVSGPREASVAARLGTLEYELKRLSGKVPLVHDVLSLYSRFPDLFQSPPTTTVPSTLSPQALNSIILSYASAFPETSSRLTSLKDLPIPPARASASLIELQPRLDKLSQVQNQQAAEIAELRAQSVVLLKRWVEVGVLAGSEVWGEWEERVAMVERAVRRFEGRVEREED
ncbi:hypothetical protein AJ80_08250 [Polytolypa hystricis UAMH7299]|uniref:UBA domain-containing protein n=1 Tax=Polytolypa hystricis (strain UAMH7299) TaxID=1447883 RepID=A0A2B7XBB9_POLH7|nr:hypothetical protein AJ80_08250 [Polytolypa hystricis UAMH7299]